MLEKFFQLLKGNTNIPIRMLFIIFIIIVMVIIFIFNNIYY